jgi:hypothetical protein
MILRFITLFEYNTARINRGLRIKAPSGQGAAIRMADRSVNDCFTEKDRYAWFINDQEPPMKLCVLFVLLSLPAASVFATFELADPANQILEEQHEETELINEEAEEDVLMWELGELADPMLCTVDTKSGECWCMDQKTARRVPMTQGECAATVSAALRAD